MNEEQLHRALPSLVQYSYTHIAAAEMLLKHKSEMSPNSAEAKAHSLLVQAKNEIERFIHRARELMDVNVVQAELTAPARQLASREPAGTASSLPPVEASA